jgi:septum site-determining protein MinC
VIVWGRLRGIVHAGIDNGQAVNAIVCALKLSPMQLRIGDKITRAPTDDEDSEVIPEIAFVQDDQIVAEPWSG